MTKPLYTPINKEQTIELFDDTTTIFNAMNLLLPGLQNEGATKQLIKQYLFSRTNSVSIANIEAFIKRNCTDAIALPDFLGILEGAKIAVTKFGLNDARKLEMWLEQKYQTQEPKISSKPGFPATDYN